MGIEEKGCGCLVVATVTMVVLKVLGVLHLSWWWVLAPITAPLAAAVVAYACLLVLAAGLKVLVWGMDFIQPVVDRVEDWQSINKAINFGLKVSLCVLALGLYGEWQRDPRAVVELSAASGVVMFAVARWCFARSARSKTHPTTRSAA